MTITVALDTYPRQIFSGQTIRCLDKSVPSATTLVKWYCVWVIWDNKPWTVTTPPSTHINLADANLNFVVGEKVVVKSSTSDLPAGLSAAPITYYVKTATSTYLELSSTLGGAAISYTDAGSGTLTISHASDHVWNPLIKPCPVTSITDLDVTLYVYDSGVTLYSSTSTGALRIYPASSAVAKPTSSLYGKVSIFIYDSTNATAINRRKGTGNPFFFQKLKVTGTMNKSGTAKFTVVDVGSATATEKGLLVADKNVAIILGHNVIWSGKILRAVQGKASLYDVATPFSTWSVECESDIGKMKLQPVKAANQANYIQSVGYIVNKLVENSAATDIDWRGLVEKSFISLSEGPSIAFTITNTDMYSQLMTLANISGFDWRTRNNFVKYLYGVSGYDSSAKTVALSAITPYTTSSFVGRWLLFTNDVNSDATSNTDGIRAYGKVTSNTTTVITMTTINNATIPPASSGNIIILGDPVLDFVYDLQQPSYQCTFTANKARAPALQNAYEMNDKSDFKMVSTKVVAKCKTTYPQFDKIHDGIYSNIGSVSIPGKDEFDQNAEFFKNSTFITRKTQGYVHSVDATNKYVYLFGQDYDLKATDTFWMSWASYGVNTGEGPYTISAISRMNASDGTPVTRLTLSSASSSTVPKYAMFATSRLYVDDNSIVSEAAPGTAKNVGCGQMNLYTGGLDADYGVYINITLDTGLALNGICPHLPGCLVSNTTYTEASPQTNSPINIFGTIIKTFVSDQNIELSILELYATNYLLNHSTYYRKGGFWSIFYDWFKTGLRPTNQVTEAEWISEGDRIAVLQNTADTATDLQYNQYKNQWQVLGWTLDAEKMSVTVELGDFEMNQNTLVNEKTAGLNSTIT